ncbi:glucokinase [Neisseria meningitidis]|nr:glucokinase [Neisseria meningitidis]
MSTMHAEAYPRLVADIGGTNARFALETAPRVIEKAEVLPCKDYDTIVDAAKTYLERAGSLCDCQSDFGRLGADDQPPLGILHRNHPSGFGF